MIKNPVIPLIAFLLTISPALHAQGMDLRETLREMAALIGQQQAELEAQRKELEEQRELIRELQAAQGIPTDTPALAEPAPEQKPVPAPEPTPVDTVAQQPAPAAPDVRAPVDEDQSAQDQAKEALVKQQAEGPKTTAEEIAELQKAMDDPANTFYDKEFPGAWYLPGTTAAMRIGGYVNLSLVDSLDPMLINDRFIVGSIPPDGTSVPGAEKGTTVSADQTRVNMEYREQTNLGEIRAFVEGDFRGDGDSQNFRLRHAFGQFRSFLAGKTWSTWMDADARPEEVDIEGLNSQILRRHALVRWTPEFGEELKLKLALEDPGTDAINGTSERSRSDLIASLVKMPLGPLGRWNYRVGFIIRDLKATSSFLITPEDDTGVTDGTTGWGITTSGRQPVSWWGDGDNFFVWQLTYGEGIGRYINDLGTIGGGDAVFDDQGKLHALPILAGYISYQHIWPKRFKFMQDWPGILRSNFTVGVVDIDNYDFQKDGDYKRTVRASTNLIYNPTANVQLGMEFLWGQRTNKDRSKGTAIQLQFAARYSF